jgi:hypothetical protein
MLRVSVFASIKTVQERGDGVGSLFRAFMNLPLFRSILRPVTRVIVGLIAIPMFRFMLRRVFRLQELDAELEKDLEQWFRGALLLLAASANMEHLLFGWMSNVNWLDRADWLTLGLRLLLAIGVIEAMPDQELFAVIHPGPPKLAPGKSMPLQIWQKKWQILKGAICQHLNRSSPVLAMMCAIVGAQLPIISESTDQIVQEHLMITMPYAQALVPIGPAAVAISVDAGQELLPPLIQAADQFDRHWERWLVGWVCYLLAIIQYLIIGLVTSRDRAMDVLSEFDRAVAQRRRELIEEFDLPSHVGQAGSPTSGADAVGSGRDDSCPLPDTGPPVADVKDSVTTTEDRGKDQT